MYKLFFTGSFFAEVNTALVLPERQTASKIDMLRFVVFIRTVLVILPGKNNKRIARFQYGLLFVEVMDKFSFRYDENFNIMMLYNRFAS